MPQRRRPLRSNSTRPLFSRSVRPQLQELVGYRYPCLRQSVDRSIPDDCSHAYHSRAQNCLYHNCEDWSGPDCVHKDLCQCTCSSTRDCTVCQLDFEVWRQAHDSDCHPFLDSATFKSPDFGAAPLDTRQSGSVDPYTTTPIVSRITD
jgi:hypothetical protein